jgi:hypothetical protein
MNTVIIQPTVSLRQPAPIRISVPADTSLPGDRVLLVDVASGERVSAQRDGNTALVAIVSSLSGERRFRIEPSPAEAGGVTLIRTGEDRDHKHHRSMWSAYGEVNGADNWSEEKNHARQVPEGDPELVSGPVYGRLTARNQWVASDGKLQFEEQRVLTVYNVGADRRLFDYEITFTASAGDVLFGDTKEGGLLSFRVASTMDAGKGQGRIENSAGGVGEKQCWGKPAAWCDYSGPVAGETAGIAVLDHPGNFRSPVHWHVRDYGLMTTNCFGDSTFAGEEGGHRGDYTLRSGHSLTFRYRVLLHRGHAAEGGVPEAFAAYTHPPSARVE